LAIRAVQVASQHAEAVRESARIRVEEGLLLDGIALDSSNVAPRNIELSALVVADFADSHLSFCDRTTMATGKAADAVTLNGLVKIAFTDVLVQDFSEGRQLTPLR
jgi:hypothetical protein